MKENKKVVWVIYIFSAVVFLLVASLHRVPKPDFRPEFTYNQPLFHAMLNGMVFLLLIFSLAAIKKKNVLLHKKLNTWAMICSLVFLLSYVVYHFFSPETQYGGSFKVVYLIILFSHIALAALSLPFILLAYYHGYIGSVSKHRKLAKRVYPVWLYVALAGVLVYVFLSPYYAS
ncbi:MAG: hypothetical protein CL840_03015 [Crocinitomicaceae bacterium]|nr:hypothetical protein [Crocinitomicaceae bacterium]